MEALRRLSRNEMEKIVLARALDLELAEPVNIGDLLQILLYRNPTGFTYSVPLELALQRPPHLFIGASPELLVQRLAGKVTANPLAGSAPRSQEPEEDRANADALVRSEKDLREHAVVVTAVRKTLERYCSNLVVSDAPAVLATPTMWHLSTTMTGQLADPSVNALDLALALHPTPTVCGSPTDKARKAIAEIESFKRGFYAGFVGWMSASGDGEWAVAIRCAEIKERWLRLFAGAGIVRASCPESELSETTGKLHTLLDALGVDELSINEVCQFHQH
jgi:isochorismate synthase